jgi:hypothetical protein
VKREFYLVGEGANLWELSVFGERAEVLARGEVVPQRVHFEDLVVECVVHLDGLAFSRDGVEVAAQDDGEAVVASGKLWDS